MAEMDDLRAEVEALRTEVARLRSEQAAHICVQPVQTMFPQPVQGAAGGALPLIFGPDYSQTVCSTPPHMTTNACAGGGAANQIWFTVPA